jgi:hypothetical protein
MILGDVHLLAGDATLAESTFRELCEELAAMHSYSHLASRAGDLADVLYVLGRFDEAYEWTTVAETHSAADDIDALIRWMPVRAKIDARRGTVGDALARARDAVQLAQTTDALNCHAKTLVDSGEVMLVADRPEDARTAFASALDLYDEKGNLVAMNRTRLLLDELALV